MDNATSALPKSNMAVADRVWRTVIAKVTAHGPPPPTRFLTPLRARAVEHTLDTYHERAAAISARLRAGDDTAKPELATLASAALDSMRADVAQQAQSRGLLARFIASGDARWGDCQAEELLDDPNLDQAVRKGIMKTLDDFNAIVESYGRFFDHLLPLANPTGPTRVLDLAAGHGGFARAAAREASRRGLDFRFTASDLKREYLDIGEELARRDGLSVEFVVQDALDLSNIAPGAYDIIVCTQSLHHFPPGLVAVMFEAATHVATRGVVFIDGCRSLLSGVTSKVIGAHKRDPAWAHDAWISTRKFFTPEELDLLARISHCGGDLQATWMPPCHCLLRWSPADSG
jgi:2-polyprenyl-3-methyl-5-hydroxy-6-metoxy-1,4-benzoquinol methylase